MCDGLRRNRTLRKLLLPSNGLSDAAAAAVASIVAATDKTSGLEEVDLGLNPIGDTAAAQWGVALAAPTVRLTKLRFSGNVTVCLVS